MNEALPPVRASALAGRCLEPAEPLVSSLRRTARQVLTWNTSGQVTPTHPWRRQTTINTGITRNGMGEGGWGRKRRKREEE